MKLYIRIGSLRKFQDLYERNEYLRKVLVKSTFNVYFIEVDDYSWIEKLLKSDSIKYEISDK